MLRFIASKTRLSKSCASTTLRKTAPDHVPTKVNTMPMKNPNHPGDIIRDCLDELGVNVTDGAKALGVTRSALSRLINRKAGVSAEIAVRLEKAIGSTAGFWLRLQLNYGLAQIQARSGKIHARRLGTPAQLAL